MALTIKPKRQKKNSPIAGVIVGVVFLAVAIWVGYTNLQFLADGIETTGTIVSYELSYNNDGDRTYYPVFTFIDQTGQEVEVRSDASSAVRSRALGQTVPVMYSPDNPYRAQIHTWGNVWLMPIIFLVAGTFALAAGLHGLVRKYAPHPKT